jgi:hypothetical protein
MGWFGWVGPGAISRLLDLSSSLKRRESANQARLFTAKHRRLKTRAHQASNTFLENKNKFGNIYQSCGEER